MAAVRCNLAVSSQVGACLDPRTLKGQTLQVPANITRIGEDGLALCTPTNTQVLSSDIVYVIDNSKSMTAGGFWVDPATNDTTWLIEDCLSEGFAGSMVPLRFRHYGGTTGADSLGIDSLFQFSTATNPNTNTRCLESNDPYSMRAQAVRVAIDYQATFDPESKAGVIYFNSAVKQRFPMSTLDPASQKALTDAVGMYTSASGTLWAPPFDTAFRWLANIPATGRSKAIILVSDGEPTDQTKYSKLLGQDGQPPIYAIYLGQSTDQTPQLDTVVAQTLGRKFVVPPDDPDSLEGVIKSIVASVTRKDAPSSSFLSNLTNGQTSRTLTVVGDTADAWHLGLDSAVGLVAGPNYIQSITTWKTTSGITVDTSIFILDVSGPTAPLGETPLAVPPFSAQCVEGSSLQFLDSSWMALAYAVEGGGPVGLFLAPSGEAGIPLRLSVTTGASDVENLALSVLDSLFPGAWGRKMYVSVARIAPAIPGNQGLEVRAGLDTLRSSWCHPRDARDCAEAMLEVRSFREAALRWDPHTLPGSSGSFILEAILPGQAGQTVQAAINRHGLKIANSLLVRVQDSLFRDTIPFLQGSRRPGGDTLWLNAPSGTIPDSLIASLVWGLDNSVLADTATITRPPLSLSIDWTGVGDQITLTLDGGQPDTRGAWPVRLSASNRTQLVNLDSTQRGNADVTILAATGKGQTWIKGIFVDPVYGDTAIDSVLVPAPSSYLKFEPASMDGPSGTFVLTADIPGATGASINVVIWRRERGLGTVTLARQADSSFAGVVNFRQGPTRPSGDTLWMNLPPIGVPDTLVATYVDNSAGDTLADMALVTRPLMRLTARSAGGTLVTLTLVGGHPDSRGTRNADVVVTSIQRVAFDTLGNVDVDVLSQLSKVSGSQATVVATFIDPVYGDTARDSVVVAVPARTLRFVVKTVNGPRGALSIELSDPWATGETRDIIIAHGRDSALVRLQRSATGLFVADRPFTQAASASGDTLTLGRPLAGIDSVYAVLPRLDSLPRLVDRATIQRPPLSLALVASPNSPQLIQMTVTGGNADSRGEARVQLSGPTPIPSTLLVSTGDLSWSGNRNLDTLLPESPDPVEINGLFVDPIYGDTARASLKIASPWFPASISVYPVKADPREDDSVEIRVRDKDAHPAKVDTIEVMAGSHVLKLVETGKNTGDYVLKTIASKVDPEWARHSARDEWRIELVYTDPDHPRDVAKTNLLLEYNVPPPEVDPYDPLQKTATHSAAGKPVVDVIAPNSSGHYPTGSQGVELKIWEPTRVMAFVYDKIGTAVGSWEGVLDPKDPETAARYLVKWDGYDRKGNPTAPGIYLIRVVLVAQDGKPLGNFVYRLGRR